MYKCEDCIRTFSRRSALRNHSKTHKAEHIEEQIRIITEEIALYNNNTINTGDPIIIEDEFIVNKYDNDAEFIAGDEYNNEGLNVNKSIVDGDYDNEKGLDNNKYDNNEGLLIEDEHYYYAEEDEYNNSNQVTLFIVLY